jgi:hypothetical protein
MPGKKEKPDAEPQIERFRRAVRELEAAGELRDDAETRLSGFVSNRCSSLSSGDECEGDR